MRIEFPKRSKRFLLLTILLCALVSGISCSKQARKDRLLTRADQDFKAERYDRAEVEYLAVLRIPPADPTALARLGLIYSLQGRLPQAMAFLRKAVDTQPENLELRLKLASTFKSLRLVKEAREEALGVFGRRPENTESWMLLVETAATTNQLAETAERLDALPPAAREKAEFFLARAALAVRRQDLAAAEPDLKEALARNPESDLAHLVQAGIYLLRNEPKQAESSLKRVADLAPPRSMTRLRCAELQLSLGLREEATNLIHQSIRQAPDFLPALNFLAQLAFSEQRDDQCAALVDKTLARDPVNFDALMLRGNLLLMKGQGTNAVAQFERVATIYGRTPRVLHRLAAANLVNGHLAQCLANLDQAIAADPAFADAILLRSEVQIRRAEARSAVTALQQLIHSQPQIAQAHLLLAQAYITLNNLSEAEAVYTAMAALFPKNPQVPLLSGTLLARQGRTAEARQAFMRARELSPDYLPALESLVDLDLGESDYAAALGRIEAQRERAPRSGELLLLLAKVHLARAMSYENPGSSEPMAPATRFRFEKSPAAQQDAAEAERALQQALEFDPTLRDAYVLLAQLNVAAGKHRDALDRLAGLAKTNDVVALMQVGMIQEELKDYSSARDAYEQLLKAHPRFSPALNNLAYLYSERLGRLEEAYVMAERARQLLPRDPHVADTLGWILCRRGEYSRALALIQESAMKLPADPEVRYHLGMAHYMLGEEAPARLAFQQALRSSAEFSARDEARQRLALLEMAKDTADPAAMAAVEARLREAPGDPVALDRYARLEELKGAYDKARDACERALKTSPQNTSIMVRLARLYAGPLNQPAKALETAKKAHALAAEDAEVSYLLGRLALQSGDFRWALSLILQASHKLPPSPELSYDLARAHYSVGQTEAAQAALADAIRVEGPFSRREEAEQFSRLLQAASDPGLAQSLVAKAREMLAADPRNTAAAMVCALDRQQQEDHRAAREYYETILNQNPLFVPAMRNLAIVGSRVGGAEDKAYEFGVRARETYPQDRELARALGVLAYRRGDFGSAVQLLKAGARDSAEDGELLYYLGMAHYKNRDFRESRVALDRAITLNIPASMADEARRILAVLK